MILPWQEQQWQQLVQIRSQQRLTHALLIQGPKGTGKLQFVEQLASALMCQRANQSAGQHDLACGQCRSCKLMAAGTHPDFTHIKPLTPVFAHHWRVLARRVPGEVYVRRFRYSAAVTRPGQHLRLA